MIKRRALATLVSLLLLSVSLHAAPAKVLSKQILDKFLKDFPAIKADLEKIGEDLEEEMDFLSDDSAENPELEFGNFRKELREAFLRPEVSKVLARYGWKEDFADVLVVVLYGFFHEMFRQIDAAYPAPEYKEFMRLVATGLHADDLAIVRENYATISAVFEEED